MAISNEQAQVATTLAPDGIIEVTFRGFLTKGRLVEHIPEIQAQVTKLKQKSQKALVLVDLSGVTGHEPAIRDLARNQMSGRYDALAICGSSLPVQMIVNWLIHAIGDNNRIRFFKQKNEARKWLLEH